MIPPDLVAKEPIFLRHTLFFRRHCHKKSGHLLFQGQVLVRQVRGMPIRKGESSHAWRSRVEKPFLLLQQ